ncbi:MAG: hypothetical protein A3K19_34025 [Lentisphaerae bacterium RIFOXYB12_FULL_65_16]|nr:MAG: hypothetical protein A3K19_34025 [Lentisphaerae bacterium RIFOXYB12_FULL_65_16]
MRETLPRLYELWRESAAAIVKHLDPTKWFLSMDEIRAGGSCAAYYDGDTLDNIKGWLETCNRTPACRGIMYTTWRDKYTLLPDFGDWVSGNSQPVTGVGPKQPPQ